MWVRFRYDASTPQMSFSPGFDVEVPDRVARRWELVWELFVLCGMEMDSWKARGFHQDTKALPASFHALELVESERPTADLEMNELVRRMAERERRDAIQEVS